MTEIFKKEKVNLSEILPKTHKVWKRLNKVL